MPLPAPPIDNRRYQDLVDEMIARIPVHTPEWTNFNASDPGITLIHLFAHLTENMLYRVNQIPERNRLKFLQLLNIGLMPAVEARGMVHFTNSSGPLDQALLPSGTELAAGSVLFRTANSLDILPVETRCYMKRAITVDAETADYYAMLYASYGKAAPSDYALYESVEIDPGNGIDFNMAMDRTVWIALLGRDDDKILSGGGDDIWSNVRAALSGRTLSLGIVPGENADGKSLAPASVVNPVSNSLNFAMPRGDLGIAFDADGVPAPQYLELTPVADFDPLSQPGIVQLTLPEAARIISWDDLDPLESGVGDLPPFINDDKLSSRIVTWLKISAGASANVKLAWMGINAAQVRQRIEVNAERLGEGNGNPDQQFGLAKAPVLESSVKIIGVSSSGQREWQQIDDIAAADPEVAVYRPGQPTQAVFPDRYMVDHEAGMVRFGDGLSGRRPATGETLYASYAYCEGREGNVGTGAISGGSLLPAGITVSNPVPTWGGSDPETVAQGEKQIRRRLQNRDRLVTQGDFVSIAWRTPGIDIGRIEVISASHPDLSPVTAGSVPGAVTLMAIPAFDASFPNAPRPDRLFVSALCNYLDPRRLVTTELAIRGPSYIGIWISIGIEIAGGHSAAEVIERVRAQVQAYLSPLPGSGLSVADFIEPLYAPETDPALRGWPLGRSVNARNILAEAARSAGVVSVANVLLAQGTGSAIETIAMEGLQLPELLGISVVIGDPLPLDSLRGASPTGNSATAATKRLPVPVMAESC